MAQMNVLMSAKTYGEYIRKEMWGKEESMLDGVQKLDIIFYLYQMACRKRETRVGRGKKSVRQQSKKTLLYTERSDKAVKVDKNKRVVQSHRWHTGLTVQKPTENPGAHQAKECIVP